MSADGPSRGARPPGGGGAKRRVGGIPPADGPSRGARPPGGGAPGAHRGGSPARARDPLEESVHAGRLKREPSSSTEIKGFLDHAKRALADASVPGLSATGRFEFAYTAAHALALAALRMLDLRPGSGPGHRAIVFLSLPQTVGAQETLASSLNRYHTRRNKSEYGDWSAASDAEADDLLALAKRLEASVVERAKRRGIEWS